MYRFLESHVFSDKTSFVARQNLRPPRDRHSKPTEEEQEEKEEEDANALLGLDDLNLSSVDVYELSNYTFGRKDRESRSFPLRAQNREDEKEHFRKRYTELGLRRSVVAVLLVHEHRFVSKLREMEQIEMVYSSTKYYDLGVQGVIYVEADEVVW